MIGPIKKFGYKSPVLVARAKKLENTEYFKLAKVMLKQSPRAKIQSSKVVSDSIKEVNIRDNFTVLKSKSFKASSGHPTECESASVYEPKLLKDWYASGTSHCSTLRLVSDTESSSSISQSIDCRKSSFRRQYHMQQKYGSRKIRKKQDIDQQEFIKSGK